MRVFTNFPVQRSFYTEVSLTRLGGEGDPRKSIPHHLQYTIIRWVGTNDSDSTLVWGTENMEDGEVIQFLKRNIDNLTPIAQLFLRHIGKLPDGEHIIIERYNCCYVCLETSPCSVLRGANPKTKILDRIRWHLPGLSDGPRTKPH